VVKPLRRSALALAAATVLALAAGAAGALGLSSAAPGPGPVPPLAEAGPVRAIEPSLSSQFALLRRSQSAADVVPGSIPVVLSQASGANLALARRVQGESGTEAWLIPGRGSACILARQAELDLGGAVCTSAGAAREGALNVQSANQAAPGWELVAGVVPDRAAQVTLHMSSGATAVVDVRENLYLAIVKGAVTAITGAGSAGPLSIPAMSAAAAG
jgi:hypothetical protein